MKTATDNYRAIIDRTLQKRNLRKTPGQRVNAYLNHGRWVADCPCGGAELAHPDHQLTCGSCGATHTPVFPADRETIETLLDARPPNNRNWRPGETVASLLADNIDHGLFPEDF